MKTRTCPECGYKYSLSEYYTKLIFKFLNANWNCKKCGTQLSFNVGRRTLITIIAVVPFGFNSIITSVFQNNIGISRGLSYFAFCLIFIIWAIYLYSFELTKRNP